MTEAEVRNLAGFNKQAASGQAGAGPRCPQRHCGSTKGFNFLTLSDEDSSFGTCVEVQCHECLKQWRLESVAEFAQFFPVSAPASQPSALAFIRNMFSESELVDSKGLLDWDRIGEAMEAYRNETRF